MERASLGHFRRTRSYGRRPEEVVAVACLHVMRCSIAGQVGGRSADIWVVVLRRALMTAVLVYAGCGRIGYEELARNDGGGGGPGAGGAGGASMVGSGGSSGTGGSVTGTGGTIGGGDAAPNTTCSQAGTPTQLWSFDTDVQGWELSGTGSMVWTGAVGDPGLGAI